jgi:Uma2 family endonuclease
MLEEERIEEEEEARTTSCLSRRPSSMSAAEYLQLVIESEELIGEHKIQGYCNYETYDTLLNGSEKRTLKVKLLDGNLLLTEYPNDLHETVTRSVDMVIGRRNHFKAMDPLKGSGSVRLRVAGQQTGIEPDASFSNVRLPVDLATWDANNTRVPVIVIETAVAEDWPTIMSSVRAYFTLGVQQVVYFKIFRSAVAHRPSRFCVTQMYMIDFRRPVNFRAGTVIRADRVVSFGYQTPHYATVQAIFSHTQVLPANFVGYGRHGNIQPHHRCQVAGMPVYRLTFPATIIWHDVPAGLIPPVANFDYHMDLFDIVDGLAPDWLPPVPW